MGNKIGVLTLHGMGTHEPCYSKSWEKNIRRRLAAGVDSDVAFGEVYYQGIMQKQQKNLWDKLGTDLGWKTKGLWPLVLVIGTAITVWIAAIVVAAIRSWGLVDSIALAIGLVVVTAATFWAVALLSDRLWFRLRQFLMYSLSDPATYAHKSKGDGSIFKLVHAEIDGKLKALCSELEPGGRVVVVAHSLGAYVFSNYIWDEQEPLRLGSPDAKAELLASEEYGRIQRIARVFTAAPNIMLFVSGHANVQPFAAPTEDFKWHSFYDNDDVLGWPLQPLPSEDENSYENLVSVDQSVNVGGFWASWNPMSHTRYLNKGTPFVKHVAEEIGDLHAGISSP